MKGHNLYLARHTSTWYGGWVMVVTFERMKKRMSLVSIPTGLVHMYSTDVIPQKER